MYVVALLCDKGHLKAYTRLFWSVGGQGQYIGYTECTLNSRITGHFYSGSIKDHFITDHNIKPTKQQILDNTTIIAKANDKLRLTIKEALLILKHSPIINRQFQTFQHTLKLHKHRPPVDQLRPPVDQLRPPIDQNRNHINDNFTNPPSPPSTSITSTHSQGISQLPPTPQALPINSTNILAHTPVSPSIQNRIDLLLQNARSHNIDTQHQVTQSPHLPYNLRPRRR